MAKLTKQQRETLRRILADLETVEETARTYPVMPVEIEAGLYRNTTDLARFIVLHS